MVSERLSAAVTALPRLKKFCASSSALNLAHSQAASRNLLPCQMPVGLPLHSGTPALPPALARGMGATSQSNAGGTLRGAESCPELFSNDHTLPDKNIVEPGGVTRVASSL